MRLHQKFLEREPQNSVIYALFLLSALFFPTCAAQGQVEVVEQSSSRARLEAVGYNLAVANASLCEQPEMLTGLLFHDVGAYGRRYRAAVMQHYGLTFGFGVLNVVPESSGEKSGILIGDEILSVNGIDLSLFYNDLIQKRESYNRIERFVHFLNEELIKGEAEILIRRGLVFKSVILKGSRGCSGKFVLKPSGMLNAWSDGRYVAISSRMMDFVSSNDELAFVVAHEMAHNILHHAEYLKPVNGIFGKLGFGARKLKLSELEADNLAISLMYNSGYDIDSPRNLLTKMKRFFALSLPNTHPRISKRIDLIEAKRCSILKVICL
jgi:Peptidase family M48